MIQRKQTLFLLIACILNAVCLCLPVAQFVPGGMGVSQSMTNLWVSLSDGSRDFSPWPLFALLIVSTAVSLCTIFLYKNRMLQSRLCLLVILLLVAWVAVYGALTVMLAGDMSCQYRFSFAAVLPVVSLILVFMARRGVIADEKLVRSMDRIR